MDVKLLSVIVLYHPELSPVHNLMNELHTQGSDLVIVDNSPNSHQEALKTFLSTQDEYHHFPQNIGLGTAHNIGIKHAFTQGYDFILIFDQDSSITADFIPNLLQTFNELSQEKKIAAIGPSYIDKRFKGMRHEKKHVVKNHTNKRMIISSGSLLSVRALKEIGLMDEDLFMDFIDTEWCYRARQKGYKVCQAAHILMTHCLGEVTPIFWGLYKMRHMKPHRYYYFSRNLKNLTQRRKISLISSISGFSRYLPLMFLKSLFLKNTKKYLSNLYKGLSNKNLG